MSDFVNQRVIEEARELIPELVSTGLDKAMEMHIKTGDMEALWEDLKQARNLLAEESHENFKNFDVEGVY